MIWWVVQPPPFPRCRPWLLTLSKYQAKRAKIRVSTSNINSTCPMEELSMDSLMLDHLTPETGNKKTHQGLKVGETTVISLKVSISKQRWYETLYIILPCGIVATCIKEWLQCSQVSTLQVRKFVIYREVITSDSGLKSAFIPTKFHLFPDSYMFSTYKDTTFNQQMRPKPSNLVLLIKPTKPFGKKKRQPKTLLSQTNQNDHHIRCTPTPALSNSAMSPAPSIHSEKPSRAHEILETVWNSWAIGFLGSYMGIQQIQSKKIPKKYLGIIYGIMMHQKKTLLPGRSTCRMKYAS